MPKWYRVADLEKYEPRSEKELIVRGDVEIFEIDILDSATRKSVHERYENRFNQEAENN